MKKLILVFSILMGLYSCSEDFTELAPISNRNVEQFYNTESDFTTAINASYAGLQEFGVYGRSYWVMFEMRGDNTDQGPDVTGLSIQFANINSFIEQSDNEQVYNAWRDSYAVISNCNVILDEIPGADIDEDLKARITGEALFLRSLMYYHLAIAFGNIPLELTATALDAELTQVDANTVYNQLLIDLAEAENNLPISYPASDEGRATKGAAATLLAKVQLTLGLNGEAQTVLRRIISDYGYILLDSYADLWGVENENNAESIFEVQYQSGGIGQGSAFTNDFSPSSFLQTGQGFARNRPTPTMAAAYVAADSIRFNASMDTTWINADGDTISQNIITKYVSDPPVENDSDLNWMVFRYADVLLMLAEALGETGESYDLINQVRARAGLDPIDASTPGTFEEKLLEERRLELAFENHRWPDLKRFGVVIERMNEAEPQISTDNIRNLFLIPEREMQINPGFVQNND